MPPTDSSPPTQRRPTDTAPDFTRPGQHRPGCHLRSVPSAVGRGVDVVDAVLGADREDAGHVRATGGLEGLGDAFKEHLKACGRGVHDHAQGRVAAVAVGVGRPARQEGGGARRHFRPDPVLPEFDPPLEDVEPLVLARVPMWRRSPARRGDHLHHGERPSRLLPTQQHRHLVAEGAENLGILGQGEGMGQNRRHAFRMARQSPAAKSGPAAEACEAGRFCQAVAH